LTEFSFLAGGGVMGTHIRAHDWSRTPLGAPQDWPQPLRTVARIMLNTGHPMYIFWGAEGTCLYNDAYSNSIGPERHPCSLGQPARQVWAEIWDIIGPQFEQVMSGGGATWHVNQLVPITRNGIRDDVYWTYSYSPIDDETAPQGVGGVLVVCTETTQQVHLTRRALEEREQFAELFQQAPTFMTLLTGPNHVFELANPGYLALIGNRDIVGRPLAQAVPEAIEQGYVALLDEVYRSGKPFTANGARYAMQPVPGGPVQVRYVDFVYQPIRNADGVVRGIFVEGVDVTERKLEQVRRDALIRLTDEIRTMAGPEEVTFAAAQILGETLATSRVGYGTIDTGAETLHVGRDWTAPGVDTLAGALRLRDFGSFIDDLKLGLFIAIDDVALDPRTAPAAGALHARAAGAFVNVPVLERGRLVAVLYVNNAAVRAWTPDELGFIREVAERARTASERLRNEAALRDGEARLRKANETLEAEVQARTRQLMAVEETLRHTHKMEAVGQLTGGLAHDFNNLLGAIQGGLELTRAKVAKGEVEGLGRYIEIALRAVGRAAALTHRLLAFSRRQTLAPTPTDAGHLVAGMEELIRRTIGPAISLSVQAVPELWPTLVDTSQLENALLNLCINARDAMPRGGCLAIAMSNRRLDLQAATELGLAPGDFLCLSVADTGSGMSPEVLARAFDPFFTTKPLGEGTGLGLSMVYGFARQSGGQIRIASSEGEGTTMRLYLPRHDGPAVAQSAQAAGERAAAATSGEVVLVVDDEAELRMLIVEVLHDAGYATVDVADGPAALAILQSDARIDLLVSDVGLPGGLNGRQVADAARTLRPGLKVLFITGYAENAVVGSGHREHWMQLLIKPFTMRSLVERVQDMLPG
jgi:signal transduction histidine kinase/CheY-like chemotaxis protein